MRQGGLLLTLACTTLACAGCGKPSAFPMAPVEGTVRYEDGSLIPAEQIRIVFEPQDMERVNGVAPAEAQGDVDVSDGTFKELTTWKYGDGVIVGRHKVTLMSSRIDERGVPQTTNAVPRKYHRASTTPLEVEVVRRGTNDFKLEITRP